MLVVVATSYVVFGIGSFVLPGLCPHMEAIVATARQWKH